MSASKGKLLLAIVCASLLTLPLQAGKDDPPKQSRMNPGYYKADQEYRGKNLAQWQADLNSKDPSVRADAVMALPAFGTAAAPLVPRLCVIARSDLDASPRAKVMMALPAMYIPNTQIGKVVETLCASLSKDDQTVVKYLAAKALPRFAAMGTPEQIEAGQKALQQNIHLILLGSNNRYCWEVREACIQVLRVAGVDPKKGPDRRVTDNLISRANASIETTWKVRLQAIMALGGMGRPQDPNKLAEVYRVLKADYNAKSRNKAIRIWSHVAVMALEEKTNDKYLETIAEYTKDHDAETRFQAVSALGALGDLGHKQIMRVVDRLNPKIEKEPFVLAGACNALANMGDRSDKVLNALIAVTEREGSRESTMSSRLAACTALGRLGAGKPQVLVALNKELERKDMQDEDKKSVEQAIAQYKKPREDDKRKVKIAGAKGKDQDTPKNDIRRRQPQK